MINILDAYQHLKNALKEVKATNKITNQIIDVAREARDIVKRNYKESAGVLKDDRVKAMMKIVSGFNRANSTIIASDIRNKISQLSSVYTQNNLGQFSIRTTHFFRSMFCPPFLTPCKSLKNLLKY